MNHEGGGFESYPETELPMEREMESAATFRDLEFRDKVSATDIHEALLAGVESDEVVSYKSVAKLIDRCPLTKEEATGLWRIASLSAERLWEHDQRGKALQYKKIAGHVQSYM